MKNKWILPVVAAIAVLAAVIIIIAVPKGGTTNSPYAQRNSDGNIVIRTADLSKDTVSFIRLGENSSIELLARIGEDGAPRVALGTCQSCNGSPNAYYTQTGDTLQCHNCGLTFPLSVLDAPGGGCHPITIDGSIVQTTQDGLLINAEALSQYEYLFERVTAH